MTEFIQVSKEEFEEFVNSYPNKLDWNVTGICEPPMGSHNDFSDGAVWPDSMVTKVFIMDGSAYYGGKHSEYYIKQSKGETK